MIQLPLPSLTSLGLSALSKMPEECPRAHLESQRGVTGKTHPAQTSRSTVGLREPWSFLDAYHGGFTMCHYGLDKKSLLH